MGKCFLPAHTVKSQQCYAPLKPSPHLDVGGESFASPGLSEGNCSLRLVLPGACVSFHRDILSCKVTTG